MSEVDPAAETRDLRTFRQRWGERIDRVTAALAQAFGRNEQLRVRSGFIISVVVHCTLVGIALVTFRRAEGGPAGVIEVSFDSLADAGLEGDSDVPEDEDEAAAEALDPQITRPPPKTDPQMEEGLDRLAEDVQEREKERSLEEIESQQTEELEALARRVKERASKDRLRGERLADLESALANVKLGYKGEIFGTVSARKVVFCIDVSGSMQGDKIELTKRELARVIDDELPDGAAFELISFASVCSRWNGSLATASNENKSSAKTWVRGLFANGGTSAFQALREAFSNAEVEAIYFLSDGAPTDGKPDDIRAWVRQANGERRVVVNTIGFLVGYHPAAVSEPRRFLEGLAEDNGGVCRIIQ